MPSRRANRNAAGTLELQNDDGDVRPLEDIEADAIRFAIAHYRGSDVGGGATLAYRSLDPLPKIGFLLVARLAVQCPPVRRTRTSADVHWLKARDIRKIGWSCVNRLRRSCREMARRFMPQLTSAAGPLIASAKRLRGSRMTGRVESGRLAAGPDRAARSARLCSETSADPRPSRDSPPATGAIRGARAEG